MAALLVGLCGRLIGSVLCSRPARLSCCLRGGSCRTSPGVATASMSRCACVFGWQRVDGSVVGWGSTIGQSEVFGRRHPLGSGARSSDRHRARERDRNRQPARKTLPSRKVTPAPFRTLGRRGLAGCRDAPSLTEQPGHAERVTAAAGKRLSAIELGRRPGVRWGEAGGRSGAPTRRQIKPTGWPCSVPRLHGAYRCDCSAQPAFNAEAVKRLRARPVEVDPEHVVASLERRTCRPAPRERRRPLRRRTRCPRTWAARCRRCSRTTDPTSRSRVAGPDGMFESTQVHPETRPDERRYTPLENVVLA